METEILQPQDHPTEPLLEAQLLQSRQIGEETNGLLEAIITQAENTNTEPVLEAMLVQDNKNTDRIVEALQPTSQAISKIASLLEEIQNQEKVDLTDINKLLSELLEVSNKSEEIKINFSFI